MNDVGKIIMYLNILNFYKHKIDYYCAEILDRLTPSIKQKLKIYFISDVYPHLKIRKSNINPESKYENTFKIKSFAKISANFSLLITLYNSNLKLTEVIFCILRKLKDF